MTQFLSPLGLAAFTPVLASALAVASLLTVPRRVTAWQPVVEARVRSLRVGRAAAFVCGAAVVGWVTAMPVLAIAGGVAAAAVEQEITAAATRRRREAIQDAVLQVIRSLRQLLESGGVTLPSAVALMSAHGPVQLRDHFQVIASSSPERQEAEWVLAGAAIGEPAFDLLAAAVAVHRPAGGRLGPLFADLEASAAAVHEVEREAQAMQVQARSAAGLIGAFPLAFLLALSALHSAYLDAYRTPWGEAFLAVALLVMAAGHVWVVRWLRLPQEPRLVLSR